MTEAELPAWDPDAVADSIRQDDLYLDMTFAQVLDDKGLDATTEDFGEMFKDAEYHLWHANLAVRRALKRGVPATLSGTPKYNAHANDLDFQIKADFVVLMTLGLPQASNDLCYRDSWVMNHGDSIYGGMFVSCIYAAAFFECDPRKLVESGLACLPSQSPYAMPISDVIEWSRQHPEDWIAAWNLVEDKWNKREPFPEGAASGFNIDAKINGAYITLGLLFGEVDFKKTTTTSTRYGQDFDYNPASAGAILGVVLGLEGIPEQYKQGIEKIGDEKFSYLNYSFRTIVESTKKPVVALAERHGGRLEGDRLLVRAQDPVPAELAVWDDSGSPVERIPVTEASWSWRGDWKRADSKWGPKHAVKASGSRGAEAAIEFEGTGAIISGFYFPTGDKAEICLDGDLNRTVEVYPDEDRRKGWASVWHDYELEDGKRAQRVVVLDEPYGDSAGSDIALKHLDVVRKPPPAAERIGGNDSSASGGRRLAEAGSP